MKLTFIQVRIVKNQQYQDIQPLCVPEIPFSFLYLHWVVVWGCWEISVSLTHDIVSYAQCFINLGLCVAKTIYPFSGYTCTL